VRSEPPAGKDLAQLEIGDQITFIISVTCAEVQGGENNTDSYTFAIKRNGAPATKGVACNAGIDFVEVGKDSNQLTIQACQPGSYEINPSVDLEGGDILACGSAHLLINTLASEWWEKQP